MPPDSVQLRTHDGDRKRAEKAHHRTDIQQPENGIQNIGRDDEGKQHQEMQDAHEPGMREWQQFKNKCQQWLPVGKHTLVAVRIIQSVGLR